MREAILDTLFPRRCVICDKEGKYICDKCELFLSEAPNNTEKLISIWEYEGVIEKVIRKIKHNGMYHAIDELVEKAFRAMIEDTARFQPFLEFLLDPDTCITYVPMCKKKQKQRGFNQAEIIAQKVAEMIKKEAVALLIKIKDNRSQTGLSLQERIENVRNSFSPNSLFVPKKAVLIDDFCASAATTEECTRALKQNGVEDIWRFVFAKSDH